MSSALQEAGRRADRSIFARWRRILIAESAFSSELVERRTYHGELCKVAELQSFSMPLLIDKNPKGESGFIGVGAFSPSNTYSHDILIL